MTTDTLTPLAVQAADKLITYTPGLVDDLLASGKTVFVDYYASWCSTCRTQERIVKGLRNQNTDYDDGIVFVRVDWDIHAGSKISTRYNIPRRSTLLLLRGDEELGRIVAGTSTKKIKALMDLGLVGA
jgi:thioredoxin 1